MQYSFCSKFSEQALQDSMLENNKSMSQYHKQMSAFITLKIEKLKKCLELAEVHLIDNSETDTKEKKQLYLDIMHALGCHQAD
tara:strand:+ start:3737 stop:3985 length:249 start_codon:yes stop_codon:yes gene_type:complete